MWKAALWLPWILLSPTWNHLICSFHSLLALSKGEPPNHLPNGRVQGGEKERNVFCSVSSLPFHNKSPFPLAHLLFKFLGPSRALNPISQVEKQAGREMGSPSKSGGRKDTDCGPKRKRKRDRNIDQVTPARPLLGMCPQPRAGWGKCACLRDRRKSSSRQGARTASLPLWPAQPVRNRYPRVPRCASPSAAAAIEDSSSHGSALPHGRGPQQGPQGDQEREQAEAQPPPRAPHQAHQVRSGHDPRGVWLCPL